MKNNFSAGLIFFILGLGAGYLASDFLPDQSDEMSMDNMSETMDMSKGGDMEAMVHPMLEVDYSLPLPSVALEVFKDKKDGYNLHLVTENFVLTPEKVNTDPIQGEGHAHVYVNGVKVSRLYSDWYNLSSADLEEGENTVMVTLNANDHSEWSMDGQHVYATAQVTK